MKTTVQQYLPSDLPLVCPIAHFEGFWCWNHVKDGNMFPVEYNILIKVEQGNKNVQFLVFTWSGKVSAVVLVVDLQAAQRIQQIQHCYQKFFCI